MVCCDKFVENLKLVTNECLSNEKKTVAKYCFFKNNLLHSNIWAMKSAKNTNGNQLSETKVEDDTPAQQQTQQELEGGDTKKSIKKQIKNSLLIFEEIKKEIIDHEIRIQQMFIQNAIISEELNNKMMWNKLLSLKYVRPEKSNYELHDLLKAEYSLENLPFDNVNGFDGGKEYDYSVFLTKLLIIAHQMDSTFQNDCKNIFNIKFQKKWKGSRDIVKCIYNSAPVKTKSRSITKSQLDYKEKSWPHSSHILDLLRCSVVFDTIDDLICGCKKFENIINSNRKNNNEYCISSIIRMKNGFNEMFGNTSEASLKSLSLDKFGYCDIKYNVLISGANKNGGLIGEVQFLVKYMLDAKKMGHSSYSFVRKQDLFEKIHQKCENNSVKSMENILNRMIVTQNLSQFSLFLENMNNNESKYVESNCKLLMLFLTQNQWTKGIKLLQGYVKRLNYE